MLEFAWVILSCLIFNASTTFTVFLFLKDKSEYYTGLPLLKLRVKLRILRRFGPERQFLLKNNEN